MLNEEKPTLKSVAEELERAESPRTKLADIAKALVSCEQEFANAEKAAKYANELVAKKRAELESLVKAMNESTGAILAGLTPPPPERQKQKVFLSSSPQETAKNYIISHVGDKEFKCDVLVTGTGMTVIQCRNAITALRQSGFLESVEFGVYKQSKKSKKTQGRDLF